MLIFGKYGTRCDNTFGKRKERCMNRYIKLFLKELIVNKDNLGQYVDSLYHDEHKRQDLNEMFGLLKSEGYISCLYADGRAYTVTLTLKGKQLTDAELKLSDMEEIQMLIEKIDLIEKLFHKKSGGLIVFDEIHDVPEFQDWLQQVIFYLQGIYDRTHDKFVRDTINVCKRRMSGTNDRSVFNEMVGKLRSIGKNIDKYYLVESIEEGVTQKMSKTPKVFISHSFKDKQHAELIVQLLRDMGLKQDMVFCSSVPGYDIGLSQDIFNTLRNMFNEHDLFMIFVHSNNYYASAVSLNEMGAAWALKTKFCSFLLPKFDFSDMKGVVNSSTISIKMDAERREVQNRLNQLYDDISAFFGVERNISIVWENARDEFIDKINAIQVVNESELSDMAIKIMGEAENDERGAVLIVKSLEGTVIQAGPTMINKPGVRREEAKAYSAVRELVKNGYLSQSDSKGEVFQLTDAAYEYIDSELK